jgi:hypothetical protein
MNSLLWIPAAGILGFGISALFSTRMKFSRSTFLIPYIVITSVFLFVFFKMNSAGQGDLFTHNWQWGVVTGILVAAFLVKSVFSQPGSRESEGLRLVFDIAWIGLAYGIIDGFFLNVMPVLAVGMAVPLSRVNTILGRIGLELLALIASLLITLVYHLGYSEFRNKSVWMVLFGNALITLTFIVSANPLGAILSHAAMHVAAVIRGPEQTIQLPPHYQIF